MRLQVKAMSRSAYGKLRVQDVAGFTFGLGVVITTLVVLDPRVSDKFSQTFYPSPAAKLLSWGDRLVDLARVLVMAVREQSIDNGPMLVLTAIGVVLVIFMVRT